MLLEEDELASRREKCWAPHCRRLQLEAAIRSCSGCSSTGLTSTRREEITDIALQAASAEVHDQIVQQPLEHGADVNTQGGVFGIMLRATSAENHDWIMQWLLEHGADVNAQGRVLVQLRATTRSCQRLLEHRADINTQRGMLGIALQAASAQGHD